MRFIGDKVLGVQKSERDMGVIVQSDLMDKQCCEVADEANKRLWMIYLWILDAREGK